MLELYAKHKHQGILVHATNDQLQMTSISLVNQGLKPLIVVALGCVFFFFFRNPGEVRQFFGWDQKWIDWIQWKNSAAGFDHYPIAIPQGNRNLLHEIPSFTELMVAVLSAPESCYLVWKCHSLLKMGQKCFFPQNEEDCLPTIVF